MPSSAANRYGKSLLFPKRSTAGLMKLHGVTTCVGFDDYLEHTLPMNRGHFETFMVVTERASAKLRRLCAAHSTTLLETSGFRSGSAPFNKGKGLNDGLRQILAGNWTMILDADIVLPSDTLAILREYATNRDVIYGAPRSMCPSYSAWMRYRESGFKGVGWEQPPNLRLVRTLRLQSDSRLEDSRQRDGEYLPLGYLQLFWLDAAQPRLRYLYPETSVDASRSDVEFALRWDQAVALDAMPVVHLPGGPPRSNWHGRRTGRFASNDCIPIALPVVFATERKFRPGAHGEYLAHFDNGKAAESGRFSNGCATGHWSEWHTSGTLENSGSYSKGLPEGKWQTWYANGTLAIERTFRKGRLHGRFLAWHPATGKLAIDASYNSGRLARRITEWHPDGTLALSGFYRAGLKHGCFRSYHPDGSRAFEARYLEGKEHGDYTVWYESGPQAMTGRYWHGRKHGRFLWAYPNGQKSAQAGYRNGRQEGPSAFWPQLCARDATLVPNKEYQHLYIVKSPNRSNMTSVSAATAAYIAEVRDAFVGFDGIVFDRERLLLLDPAFVESFKELVRTSRGFEIDAQCSRARTPALLDLRWPSNWPATDVRRHPRYRSPCRPDAGPIIEDHDRLASIVHRYSGAYYHWLIESVPRLLQLRKRLDRDKTLRVLVDYDDQAVTTNTWTDEYLRLLEVDASRVVRYDSSKIYAAERILLPGPVDSGNLTAERLAAIRRCLLPSVKPSHPRCLIAVNRTRATCRRVTNWPEVLDALRRACGEREVIDFDAEQFTVVEQIALFAGAAGVVGPHGAGLANTVYCPRSARVVELLPRDHRRPQLCFQKIAQTLGIRHRYLIGAESGLEDDFQVDARRVASCTARALGQ